MKFKSFVKVLSQIRTVNATVNHCSLDSARIYVIDMHCDASVAI